MVNNIVYTYHNIYRNIFQIYEKVSLLLKEIPQYFNVQDFFIVMLVFMLFQLFTCKKIEEF